MMREVARQSDEQYRTVTSGGDTTV